MKNWNSENRLAVRQGVAAGYGFEATLCSGGEVAVCASDWRTVDKHWLREIETGVSRRDYDGKPWHLSTWE